MNTSALDHVPRPGRWARVILGLLLLLGALPVLNPMPAHAFPSPVQIYYVTLPETDGLDALDSIATAAISPMWTYFSIAIALDGTYVYYDQWEDGYADDIANPTLAEIYSASNLDGVQVWGNGEDSDGCAPNIAGTPVTCTDANDVLNAGDIIIPYNSVDVPRLAAAQAYVLDQFATVAYNNQNGNANWSTDWVETGDDISPNYRDEFGTAAYNNSNGSLNWTGSSWTEVGESDGPATGLIRVDTGRLRFGRGSASAPAGMALYRAANLSGYSSATLSYSYEDQASDSNDAVQVQVRNPDGAWYTLATINGASGSGTGSHDITAYIDTDTEVRFYVSQPIENDEYIYFDNVDIALTPSGASGPAAGDILITGGALRLTATEAEDRIDRGVDLSAGDDCSRLTFTLGQSGIDTTGDNLAVQFSSDGTNYTTIDTYTSAAAAGAKSYSIAQQYRTASFRVRFRSVDALESGEYWTVDDARIEWLCGLPILFDGGDKIGATYSIAMARATWANGSGTLNAFAHEMYPVNEWGTAYESPVGTNTTNAGEMFQYSGLSIMAAQDNTTVDIDANADNTYETSVVLNEGEATLVPSVSQGARVESDGPVQVVLVTGDVGSTYASRDMNLLPVSTYGPSYWSSVGVVNGTYPTRLFLYNPSTNGSIYITCERYGVANITLGPVAARGVTTTDLATNGQGAHCYASDASGTATADPIFAVGTIDSPNTAYDWSFTLYPDAFLTTEVLVGLGLGRDPTSGTTPTENGSPLWVTTVCNEGTYVYVDWDNNGTADPIDTNGDDTAETESENGILVNRLQSVRLFEPGADNEEYDQTGARVWSRTASGVGYGGTAGCKLAVAWGQDPANATAGAPGLDVGTSVPPLRLIEATKALVLLIDNDGDGLLSPGDNAVYNMTVKNSGGALVQNVYMHDTVPDNMVYVEGTTEYNMTGTAPWTNIPDDNPTDPGYDGTRYPLDVTGGVGLGDLEPSETYYVRFQILLNSGYEYGQVENCDVAYTGAGNQYKCATNLVAAYDWGDLPDTYGTSSAANGPRHSPSGLRLGAWFDRELEGQPIDTAAGDDNTETTQPRDDDEDGVSNAANGESWAGGDGAFSVTVTGGPGCLNAWMDFTNDDGDYPTDPAYGYYADGNFTNGGSYDTATIGATTYSEHIILNAVLDSGTTNVPVSVPPDLNRGGTTLFYVRFRLSPAPCGTIAPTGLVAGGEVEDYQLNLGSPTAVKLVRFEAAAQPGGILLTWETASEVDNLGFNLYRAESPEAEPVRLNEALIPSQGPGSPIGFSYTYPDSTPQPGITYYYWLEDVDVHGTVTRHGPVWAILVNPGAYHAFLPTITK